MQVDESESAFTVFWKSIYKQALDMRLQTNKFLWMLCLLSHFEMRFELGSRGQLLLLALFKKFPTIYPDFSIIRVNSLACSFLGGQTSQRLTPLGQRSYGMPLIPPLPQS